MSAAQCRPLERSQAAAKPALPVSAIRRCDGRLIGFRGGGGEGECHLGQAQLEQAIAAPRLAVVVALRGRAAEDLDLAIVQSEPAVDRRDLRFERALIRQKQPRRAAFDDRRRDGAAVDIRQRLGGEDDARVLLPQRLQPLAQLAGKAFVVECEPALVDDEQRGPAVEPVLDAVEQVGRARRARRPRRSAPRSRTPAHPPRRDARSRHRAAAPKGRPACRAATPASARWTATGRRGR